MSRNENTQKQLDFLQQHIIHLQKLNNAKDEKIKTLLELPVKKNSVATPELIKAKKKLENEINELTSLKAQLGVAIHRKKNSDDRIKELEALLSEERKLREYSETFAEQVELKCAEEALIRDLTSELCNLQKDEIEIENKHISDLQKKNEELKNEIIKLLEKKRQDEKLPEEIDIKESSSRDINLKLSNHDAENILLQTKNILDQNFTPHTSDEQQEKLESWLGEINEVLDSLNDIKEIKKDLINLKNKIENKKKFFQLNAVTHT